MREKTRYANRKNLRKKEININLLLQIARKYDPKQFILYVYLINNEINSIGFNQ